MMKKLALLFALCMLAATTQAQPDYSADHASEDAIMAALYEVISGPQGQDRDWDRFRALFAEGARLMPTGLSPEGQVGMRVWSVEDYIGFAGNRLTEMGFFEDEIHRVTEQYGPVVHAFSTYESRRDPSEAPFVRGINSIQLLNDGTRWYIVSIFWSGETEANPIPAEYGG